MQRHFAAFVLLASLAIGGCGPRAGGEGTDTEVVPAVATPVPATTAQPQITVELRGFAAHDANRDGFVTSAENAGAADKIFRAIDADRNGTMTATELNAARVALGLVMVPGTEQLIVEADQDNDGKLTLAEWIAKTGRDFTAADADGDGRLSIAEWNARPHLDPVAVPTPPQGER